MAQVLGNIVVLAARYGFAALGISLIYRCAGYLDFAQGAMFVLGAYGSYCFSVLLGLPVPVSILLGAVVAGMFGAGIDQTVYRPLRRKQRPAFAVMISSLGLLVVIEHVVALIFSDASRALPIGDPKPGHLILGARITGQQLVMLSGVIITASIMTLVLQKTRLGLYLRALGSDRELLTALGGSSETLLLNSAALGSLLSGLAGGISALELDMCPMSGNDALLPAVLVTLLGGAGNVWGVLLAGLVMAGLEGLIGSYISLLWREALAFLIVIILIFFRPQGLLGKRGGDRI